MGLLKIFLFQAIVIGISECGLLRQPKVYNAVITTDDNLQPSRAFPVVQPVLETGYGGYPFSYLGGYPQYHGNYDFSQFYNKFNQHQPPQFSEKSDQPTVEQPQEQEPNQDQSVKGKDQKTQIPLNDLGLPPSLIPLSTYGQPHHGQHRPIALQPYPFSSYPLTYDPFGGYNQNPYLPPFNGYYPSVASPPQNPGNENKDEEEQNKKDEKEEPEDDQKSVETTQKTVEESTETDVKNITKKDKNIPDVPAPPIPSGGNKE